MRTTVSSGSLAYRRRVPCRSVNRRLHAEQYSRRMSLCLPVHSTTERLPASNRLKWEQSGLGQAKPASEPTGFASGDAGLRPMSKLRAPGDDRLILDEDRRVVQREGRTGTLELAKNKYAGV